MSRAITLTAADLKLLKLVQQNSNMNRQELADKAGMSPSTLWRRLSELEATGAIAKRVALLDPEVVGIPVCVFVSVNMAGHDRTTRGAFEQFVTDAPEIAECFSVTGAYDYVLMVRARSIAEFEEFLMHKILGHASVASAYSQIALRQHKYTTELPV